MYLLLLAVLTQPVPAPSKIESRQPQISDAALPEISGLISATPTPDLPDIAYWAHNDSGDYERFFALRADGSLAATFLLRSARNRDWEDITAGPLRLADRYMPPGTTWEYKYPDLTRRHLFLAAIGDNSVRNGGSVYLYAFPEPTTLNNLPEFPIPIDPLLARRSTNPTTVPSLSAHLYPPFTQNFTKDIFPLAFQYPDNKNNNAEGIFIHPTTGDLYLFIKVLEGPAELLTCRAPFFINAPNALTKLTVLDLPAPPPNPNAPHLSERRYRSITGAAISPDAKQVALCTYSAAYLFTLPEGETSLDAIWTTTPTIYPLPDRGDGHGNQWEAICFNPDGKSLAITCERGPKGEQPFLNKVPLTDFKPAPAAPTTQPTSMK